MYEKFFAYARERQSIFLKKSAGLPRPWTEDRWLDHYKFCSIFREDDRTTIWLRENIREKIPGPELLLATIVFRWFNRITTGEAIFTERDYLGDGRTAWAHFLEQRSTEPLRTAILAHVGYSGPYVTGAYCIIGMPNMPKLDGILACIENVIRGPSPCLIVPGFTEVWWLDLANYLMTHEAYLEEVWDWFRDFPRGLNRIHGRLLDRTHYTKKQTNQEMADILSASRLTEYWPQPSDAGRLRSDSEVFVHTITHPQSQWPAWDMRTVEHTLCEFDKYSRVQEGGHVKGVYRS